MFVHFAIDDSTITFESQSLETIDRQLAKNQSSELLNSQNWLKHSSLDEIMTNLIIKQTRLSISNFMLNRFDLFVEDDFATNVENKKRREKKKQSRDESKKQVKTIRKKKRRRAIDEAKVRDDSSLKSCKHCEETCWSQDYLKTFKLIEQANDDAINSIVDEISVQSSKVLTKKRFKREKSSIITSST